MVILLKTIKKAIFFISPEILQMKVYTIFNSGKPVNEILHSKEFKEDIEHFSLNQLVDFISTTCIIEVNNHEKNGALFFKTGNLIDARIDQHYDIGFASEILNWDKGTFIYQKWENTLDVHPEYLKDVFHFVEISQFNTKISIDKAGKCYDFYCSGGAIVRIEPYSESSDIFKSFFISNHIGKIKVQIIPEPIGVLKLFFSEIVGSNMAIDSHIGQDETIQVREADYPYDPNTDDSKCIDLLCLQKVFDRINLELEDCLIGSNIYTSKTGKPLFVNNSQASQSVLFAKFFNSINTMLSDSDFGIINDYYIIDVSENMLIFVLTFNKLHFGYAFNKKKVKLGYIMNVIKPILAKEYYNATGSL